MTNTINSKQTMKNIVYKIEKEVKKTLGYRVEKPSKEVTGTDALKVTVAAATWPIWLLSSCSGSNECSDETSVPKNPTESETPVSDPTGLPLAPIDTEKYPISEDNKTLPAGYLSDVYPGKIKAAFNKDSIAITGENLSINGVVTIYTSSKKDTPIVAVPVNDNFSAFVDLEDYRFQGASEKIYLNQLYLEFSGSSAPSSTMACTFSASSLPVDDLGMQVQTKLDDNGVYELLGDWPLGNIEPEHLEIPSYQDLVLEVLPLIQDISLDPGIEPPTIGLINYYYAGYTDSFSEDPFDPSHNKYNAEDSFLLAYMVHYSDPTGSYNKYDFYRKLMLNSSEQNQDIKEQVMLILERVDRSLLWEMTRIPNKVEIESQLNSLGIGPFDGDDYDTILDDPHYLNLARVIIDIFNERTLLPYWDVPNIGNYGKELFEDTDMSRKFQSIEGSLQEKVKISLLDKLYHQQSALHLNFDYKGEDASLTFDYNSQTLSVDSSAGGFHIDLQHAYMIFDVLLSAQVQSDEKVILDLDDIEFPELFIIDRPSEISKADVAGIGAVQASAVDLAPPAKSLLPFPISRQYNHRDPGTDFINAYYNDTAEKETWYRMPDISKINIVDLGPGWSSSTNVVLSFCQYTDQEAGTNDGYYVFKAGNSKITFDTSMNILTHGSDAVLTQFSEGLKIKIGEVTYTFSKMFDKQGVVENYRWKPFYRYLHNRKESNTKVYSVSQIDHANGGKLVFNYNTDSWSSNSNGYSYYPWGVDEDKYTCNVQYTPKRISSIDVYNNDTYLDSHNLNYLSDDNSSSDYYRLSAASTTGFNGQSVSTQYNFQDGLHTSSVNNAGEETSYSYQDYGGHPLLEQIFHHSGSVDAYTYSKLTSVDQGGPGDYAQERHQAEVDGQTLTTVHSYDFYNQTLSGSTHENSTLEKVFINKQRTVLPNGNQIETETYKGKPLSVTNLTTGQIEEWQWNDNYTEVQSYTINTQGKTITTEYSDYDLYHNPGKTIQTFSDNNETVSFTTLISYNYSMTEQGFNPKVAAKEVWRDGTILIQKEEYEYNEKARVKTKKESIIGEYNQSGQSQRISHYEYTENGYISKITLQNWDLNGTISYESTSITISQSGEEVSYKTTKGNLTSEKIVDFQTGLTKREIDINGHTTSYTYDEKHRITQIAYANGAKKKFEYFELDNKNQLKVTLANGASITQTYNKKGQLIHLDNPTGLPDEAFEYDINGKLITKTSSNDDGESISQYLTYDEKQRLTNVSWSHNQDSNQRIYDEYFRTVSTTKNNQRTTQTSLDPMDAVNTIEYPQGSSLQMEFSDSRSIRKITDSNGIPIYSHNSSIGTLDRENYQFSTYYMTYDANNNLLQTRFGEEQKTLFTNSYDDLGRNIGLSFGSGQEYQFGYDTPLAGYSDLSLSNIKGRLSWVQYNEQIERLHSYTDMGLIDAEVQDINGEEQITEYQHDLMGNITLMFFDNGTQVAYGYNSINQLADLQYTDSSGKILYKTSFQYNNWGLPKTITINGDYERTIAYDEALRPSIERFSYQGDLIEEKQSSYDSMNRIEQLHFSYKDGHEKVENYAYDDLDRLMNMDSTEYGVTSTYRYEYDANGNRTWINRDGLEYSYEMHPGTNRISVVRDGQGNPVYSFNWDDRGNLIEKNDHQNDIKTTYIYNNLDQLISVKKFNASDLDHYFYLAEYSYNSKGLMTFQNNDGERKYYSYNKYNQLTQILNENNVLLKEYLYAGGTRVAEKDSIGDVTLYHKDRLGSRTGDLVNGQVTNEQQFTPYGLPIGSGSDETSFTDKLYNPDTGLYYFKARWYDPELGIFLTPDPAKPDTAYPDSFNPYQYCANNPIMNIDPDGRFLIELLGAAIVAGSISAGINISIQLLTTHQVSWQDAGNAFGKGALMGGISFGVDALMRDYDLGSELFDNVVEHGIKQGFKNVGYKYGMNPDGSFDALYNSFDEGFSTGVYSGVLKEAYTAHVGYRARTAPGVGVMQNRQKGEGAKEWFNVIGNPTGGESKDWFESAYMDGIPGREGGPLSTVLNLFPGMNSFAHLHDNMCVDESVFGSALINLGTMIPAMYLNVFALQPELNILYH